MDNSSKKKKKANHEYKPNATELWLPGVEINIRMRMRDGLYRNKYRFNIEQDNIHMCAVFVGKYLNRSMSKWKFDDADLLNAYRLLYLFQHFLSMLIIF